MLTEHQREASCQHREGHMFGVERAPYRLSFRTAVRLEVLQTMNGQGRFILTANSLVHISVGA
jgi:hypothetical protein